MKCWQCGEELETDSVVRSVKESSRADVIALLIRDAGAHRERGRAEAANALEALADELLAAPVR